jgi:hypothetical protein
VHGAFDFGKVSIAATDIKMIMVMCMVHFDVC